MSSSKCSLKVTHNRTIKRVKGGKDFGTSRLNYNKIIVVVSGDVGKHLPR
jgi:hypothetical protein